MTETPIKARGRRTRNSEILINRMLTRFFNNEKLILTVYFCNKFLRNGRIENIYI